MSTIRQPIAVLADLTIESDVRRLMKATIDKAKKLDVLVNNAGAGGASTMENVEEALNTLDKVLNIDLRSVYYLSHLAVPFLERTKGNIINISSVAAIRPVSIIQKSFLNKVSIKLL